jgi:hypothetical protein
MAAAKDPPSIASPIAKIDRANQNILNLDTLFTAFIDRRPYTVVDEPDPNPKTRGFKVTSVEDVGLPLRVLVGEIAHHLRSAFDLMVYQLMIKAGITDQKRLENCAFPVITKKNLSIPKDRKEYEDIMSRKIKGVCPSARTRIEDLQPCRTTGGDTSFLAQIDLLDNTDKHRLLLALIGAVNISGFNFRDADGTVVTMGHRTCVPLQPDAVIKVELPSSQMNMDLKIPLQITFGESGILWCKPVIPTLQELSDMARATILTFDKFF